MTDSLAIEIAGRVPFRNSWNYCIFIRLAGPHEPMQCLMMGDCPDVGSDLCGAKAGGGLVGPPGERLARGEEGEVRGLERRNKIDENNAVRVNLSWRKCFLHLCVV